MNNQKYTYLEALENWIKSKPTRQVVDYPDSTLLSKKHTLEFFD